VDLAAGVGRGGVAVELLLAEDVREEPLVVTVLDRGQTDLTRVVLAMVRFAFSLALSSAGMSSVARIPMMAMTTSSSISVKPRFWRLIIRRPPG